MEKHPALIGDDPRRIFLKNRHDIFFEVFAQYIIEKFNGGPIGLDTLSAAVSEEKDTLGDVYEPFLIQRGYIKRTPRGRVATQLAYKHFGIKIEPEEEQAQKRLFKK